MQQETTADVQRDMAETRARVSATLTELEAEVGSRKAAVRDQATAARDQVTEALQQTQAFITTFARERPWAALAVAFSVGALLARSGADRAAVRGAAGAATGAARGIAGVAGAGVAKAKGLIHRDGSAGTEVDASRHDPQTGAIGSSSEDVSSANPALTDASIGYRLRLGLVEALAGDELIEEMRREAGRIGRG